VSERGVGDRFFIHVINNQYVDTRMQRAAVTPIGEERRSFEELPENTFDRSDRKLPAVAVSAEAVVLNATDSDWGEQKELMDALEVESAPSEGRWMAMVKKHHAWKVHEPSSISTARTSTGYTASPPVPATRRSCGPPEPKRLHHFSCPRSR